MNIDLEYAAGEKPLFALCEPSFAGSLRPWCIRRVGTEGLKCGGGIPSGPLCHRWDCNGWDLRVRIRPEHFERKANEARRFVRTAPLSI